jgi:hypothetical protein
MSNDTPRLSVLDELDARQDQLLAELEKLNSRIEQVLCDCLAWRGADPPASRPS